ncbi:MAG: MFS transporter [Planctomycetaceae bacterium]|jgi:acyl-[acyl-carrier-protein]-phospholipid O-acyltransferase/long-chain-fatty-acid--[acyl-carrier-protein] ligase
MTESDAPAPVVDPRGDLPESMWGDSSFLGMLTTQLLGAFNDNLFKQVALLTCIDHAKTFETKDQQSLAMGLFALPFVLFSGFAGYLSDRYSKRWIVVLCKLAEIAIVILGTLSLWRYSHAHSLYAIFAVLFLMGTHSAFFGPSKFGILPEILREKNLPAANGVFLMTTFLAIILGQAMAGVLKQHLIPDYLLVVGLVYVLVAGSGLLTALLVRRTPSANPALKINRDSLLISRDMLHLIGADRPLMITLLMSSVFWLVGGIVQPCVNDYGKQQLGLSDTQTSLMLVTLVLGIAIGCVLGGWMSGERADFRLVRWGSWGMIGGLVLMGLVGASAAPVKLVALTGVALFLCGLSAGMFAVPLQVFLQSRPPADKKGQMIGAMNLANWIAILISAVLYGVFAWLLGGVKGSHTWRIFLATAALLLPMAVLFRPFQNIPPPPVLPPRT